MISGKNPMVTIEDRLSIADQLGLFWRRNSELFPHSEDPRFFNQYGYLAIMEKGISNLFKRNKISGKDIKRAILSSPDHRSYRTLAKKMGIDEATLQQPQLDSLGDTGSPHPLILLSSAFEELDPGDLILLAHYGEGVDVFLFQATEYISKWKNQSAISRKISDTATIPVVYGKHLLWRNLIKRSPEKIHPFTSNIHTWRESRQLFQLIGCKCPNCETVNYPVRKVCFNCENSEGLEEIKLSRKGTIASFTHDYVYITPDPPLTMALVDLESDGRILLQMTDKPKKEKIQIGTPVELTFRKLMEGDDFLNYFWKCKIRG